MASLPEVLSSRKFSAALTCSFALLSALNTVEGRAFFAIFYGITAIFWIVFARAQRRKGHR